MTEAEAGLTSFNPFDLTRVRPRRDLPPIELRGLDLNRNPDNDFAEVAQAAVGPANVAPRIGHRPDRTPQFRIVSCGDAHRGSGISPRPIRPMARGGGAARASVTGARLRADRAGRPAPDPHHPGPDFRRRRLPA